MAVAYKITKEDYDALPDALKSEYSLKGDAYLLDLTGVDLKAHEKFEGERTKRRDAEKQLREANTKISELEDADDRQTLIDKHTKEIEKITKQKDAAEGKLLDMRKANTVGKDALALAEGLSKQNAKVLLPHIEKRLGVDLADPENPKTIVLDAAGKATDKKLEDLRAEFLANADFKGIVTASSASGGAASKPGVTGRSGIPSGTGTPANQGERPDLNKLSAKELAARITARRAEAGLEVPETA